MFMKMTQILTIEKASHHLLKFLSDSMHIFALSTLYCEVGEELESHSRKIYKHTVAFKIVNQQIPPLSIT